MITSVLNEFPVMEQDGVHVICHVLREEYKGFVKAVILRSTTFFYSKMPFAENSGLVLGLFIS